MSCPKDCIVNVPHIHDIPDSNVYVTVPSIFGYPFSMGRFILLGEQLPTIWDGIKKIVDNYGYVWVDKTKK